MLPEINAEYANFVLNYAKEGGLSSIVRNLDMSEDKTHVEADLQPDLIQAFSNEFPETQLEELDNTVQWILITLSFWRSR